MGVFKLQKNCNQSCSSKIGRGGGGGVLFEMTFGLVHASYSLSEWQTVNLTFFAPRNMGFQTTKTLGISADD